MREILLKRLTNGVGNRIGREVAFIFNVSGVTARLTVLETGQGRLNVIYIAHEKYAPCPRQKSR